MTKDEYLNMVMSHLEEAVAYHAGANAMKFRATGPMDANLKPEVATHRRQLMTFSVVLLERERDKSLALGFKQYEQYLAELVQT